MITLATWNINSVRTRLEALTAWLAKNKPDILMLQEIKCKNDAFPFDAITAAGYHAQVHGQPSYNGVAILSREPVELVTTSLPGDDGDTQSRFLDVRYKNVRLINVYAPNGNPIGTEKFTYKLAWLQRLKNYCQQLLHARQAFAVGGDFNIIPEDLDAANPRAWLDDALFQPESRAFWKGFRHLGLTDVYRALHPEQKEYTFWDYQAGAWERNNGIRIDHFLLSPFVADRLEKVWIDKEPRGAEKPSDHTPVLIQINL